MRGTNERIAKQIGWHVDNLVAWASSKYRLECQTALWLGEIGDKLHAKLARAGLVVGHQPASLGEFRTAYIDYRTDLKNWTIDFWEETRENLVEFFGTDRSLHRVKWTKRRIFDAG